MRKLNFYFGLAFFAVFLFSGYYMVNHVLSEHSADMYLRMQNRANHVYLLFVALMNVMAYKCDYANASKWLENTSRGLLLLAGIGASVGFFIEATVGIDGRMIVPTAVGLTFLSVVFFCISLFKRKECR